MNAHSGRLGQTNLLPPKAPLDQWPSPLISTGPVLDQHLVQIPAVSTLYPNGFLGLRSSFPHRKRVVLESYISRLFSKNKLVKNKSQVWPEICHRRKDTTINLCIQFKSLIKQWKKELESKHKCSMSTIEGLRMPRLSLLCHKIRPKINMITIIYVLVS